MTLAHRSTSTSRLIVCIALVALTSSCVPDPTPSQLTVISSVEDYNVGPERAPATESDTTFPGPVYASPPPPMTIATLTLKPGRPRGSRQLLARITSEGDYAPMGIVEGENYLWRNTWDSTVVAAATWINVVTPKKYGKADHVLTRDPRPNRYPAAIGPHVPRLIVLSVRSFRLIACLDDPSCSTGHCGSY